MGRRKKRGKPRLRIVGTGQGGEPIVNGDYILYLRDSEGMPMSAINYFLKEEGMGFDVAGFIQACKANPNFDEERCLRLLKEDSDIALHERFEWLVSRIYANDAA